MGRVVDYLAKPYFILALVISFRNLDLYHVFSLVEYSLGKHRPRT